MSYNIDSCQVLEGTLSITRQRLLDFLSLHDDSLPEDCFLHDLPTGGLLSEILPIEKPSWRGEGSEHSEDIYKKALAVCDGSADIMLIWEGGDSVTGLRVRDGKVTEHKVRYVLED